MTYDEAGMACVSKYDAILAPPSANAAAHLSALITTCAEWEAEVIEPWVARRLGDIDCPFMVPSDHDDDDGGENRVRLQNCGRLVKRAALCWRLPTAWYTDTVTDIEVSTLTEYQPSIVGTVTLAASTPPSGGTVFTWTSTETVTSTLHKRVPHYILEYDLSGSNVTLTTTDTIHYTSTITKPAVIVQEVEWKVGVEYETFWETSFTATSTIATVTLKC
jgi:hypothetical protein